MSEKGHSHGDPHSHSEAGKTNKEVWDEKSGDYDADSKDFVEKAIPCLSNLLAASGVKGFDKDRRALDFGAGTGNLAIPLSKLCGHVTAVDVSPGMLKVLQQKIKGSDEEKRIEVLCCELKPGGNNPIEPNSFDVVLCSMVLHHVPDMKAILKMFKAFLKPNGLLFVYDFAIETKTKEKLEDKKDVFSLGFTPMSLLELVQGCGFRVVQSSNVFSFGFKEFNFPVIATVGINDSMLKPKGTKTKPAHKNRISL
ncbi:hypothetical protein AAMO2058_000910000 [Amorphochlora amoebiformis]